MILYSVKFQLISHIFNIIDRYFNPVGKPWQFDKCKLLDDSELVETPEFYEDTIKVLNHPSKFQIIGKDGNCLFRALSYWVTGTQKMHVLLREKVAEVSNITKKNYIVYEIINI